MTRSVIRSFIKDLETSSNISNTFLLKSLNLAQAKDGKKYINATFSDKSGDLEARMWGQAEQIASEFKSGDFVLAHGKVHTYQGRRQFVISKLEAINIDSINQSDFFFSAQRPADEMYEELVGLVSKLEDVYIKELLLSIIQDTEISRRLKTWQAGKTIHHAYKSGLLEHILSCSNLGVSLSAHYQCNTSYVVAGCILHDLCKIYELTDGSSVEYTEEGKLIGHLVKGLEIVDRFAYRIEGFPYQMKMHLKHILLSHHGHYEYGSPKIPMTSEANLVHLIDYMDSKMNGMETIKRLDPNQGHWSNYVRHMDRIIYKDELPTFKTKEEAKESREKKEKRTPKKRSSQPLKNSLGDKLSGLIIDDN